MSNYQFLSSTQGGNTKKGGPRGTRIETLDTRVRDHEDCNKKRGYAPLLATGLSRRYRDNTLTSHRNGGARTYMDYT